ncbi:helix-turn-helix domain-containing protein [Gordonia jinghuaiqii]|uniref:AraC family transcriptional regulator n=1 Tax=Gordonia jinghuaiqii TaxID=2758710 RepID=A0A7D7LYN0_9ACTN|nr:helix-turn-helix domain-containing protein [Gordonia jinghuaiqii]QMT02958.1 AraC family transcriptional regulator [Gordonia jinghuaiqii]
MIGVTARLNSVRAQPPPGTGTDDAPVPRDEVTSKRVVYSGNADWDEVHHVVADAYFPHELRPLSRDDASRYRLESTAIGSTVLARIGFGADVSIDSDHPGAWAINIPLAGRLSSITEGREIVSEPGQATLNPPDTPTVITNWSRTCEIIGFKIDRDYLQREIDRIAGRPGRSLVRQLDLRTGAGAEWLGLLRSARQQVAQSESVLLRNERMAEQLGGMLTTALVVAALPETDEVCAGTRPRTVKRVIDAIHLDPAHPWTVGELAEIGAVSARRLQQGFRECVGLSPMEYLLDVRLECIHNDLLAGSETATITDIATRWGVMHTGRFAAAYRRKYGVTPSETRRHGA